MDRYLRIVQGESNLKPLRPALPSGLDDPAKDLRALALRCECESPNASLHEFQGQLAVTTRGAEAIIEADTTRGTSSNNVTLARSNLLLRGSTLRNSEYVCVQSFGL